MMPLGGRRRPLVRRRSIEVSHGGQVWERDLMTCRVVLAMRRLEGRFATVEEFAGEIGLNPDTVYRWLRGDGPGSAKTTTRVLAGLGVGFEEVHRKLQARAVGGGPVKPSG